jgi:hypothetical protein
MPAMPADVQQQLNDAFESFKSTLQDLLTAEARRSVDGAIKRISGEAGAFRLDDVTVEVVIKDLKLTNVDARPSASADRGTGAAAPAPRARPAKPAARRASGLPPKRGRPVGGVRLGVLATFAGVDSDLSTVEIRDRLQASGVKATTDNLHQQLRRLVQAGDLVRTGRGRYARTSAPGVIAAAPEPAPAPDPEPAE